MAGHLGRSLTSNENVHHLNGNRLDNLLQTYRPDLLSAGVPHDDGAHWDG